jgi:hypothetical protein
LSDAEQTGRRLTPAGTWLLDNNISLIDEHVAIARRDLPSGCSRAANPLSDSATKRQPGPVAASVEAVR